MPVATLKFKLPEEKDEFELAQQASSLSSKIEEFGNFLRSEYKYKDHTAEVSKYLEEVRAKWFEVISDET